MSEKEIVEANIEYDGNAGGYKATLTVFNYADSSDEFATVHGRDFSAVVNAIKTFCVDNGIKH